MRSKTMCMKKTEQTTFESRRPNCSCANGAYVLRPGAGWPALFVLQSVIVYSPVLIGVTLELNPAGIPEAEVVPEMRTSRSFASAALRYTETEETAVEEREHGG